MNTFQFLTLAASALLIVATGCNSDSGSLVVRNTSETPIDVQLQGSDGAITLRSNGVASTDAGDCLLVGDAAISFSDRIEVANLGEQLIELDYVDAAGRNRTMILGQGGIGYFSALHPVMLGKLVITKSNG